ncbi:TPA: type II secretion system F family protein [Vibrio harveyi]|nr:type II secretion system F family protein [Vibrio harveyi]
MDEVTISLILLFAAVLLISQALLLPVVGKKSKHRELSNRLKQNRNVDEQSLSLLKEHYRKELSPTDQFLVRFSFFADIRRVIELAGLKVGVASFLMTVVLVGFAFALVGIMLKQEWYICVALFFLSMSGAYFYVQRRVEKRLALFEEQLPEALDIIRRSLQGGQPLVKAFREVGEEMSPPISIEFQNTYNLLNFGYDLRLAILQMAERVPTISMLAFSSAVLLQKETGGNLTENLQNVSQVLRARFKLERKIKTLSAESRLSAWILTLSPFILFLGLKIFNPEYIEPLYADPRGLNMISIGVILLAIGAVWIKKIVSIEI